MSRSHALRDDHAFIDSISGTAGSALRLKSPISFTFEHPHWDEHGLVRTEGVIRMNQIKVLSAVAVALGLGSFAVTFAASAVSPEALKAQAKVPETDARATALARVPGGAVQSAELEIEHGKLVWSFDIKTPKSFNVVEVQVDAKTGRIVSRKIETPAEQAKEAKADNAVKP